MRKSKHTTTFLNMRKTHFSSSTKKGGALWQSLLLLPLVTFLFTGQLLYAQGNKLYTLDDVTPGGRGFYSNFYPKTLWGLQWLGERAVWLDGDKLVGRNLGESKPQTVMTLQELAKLIPQENWSSRQSFPYGEASQASSRMLFAGEKGYYVVDMAKKALCSTFPKFNHLGESYEAVAFSMDHDVAVMRSQGGVLTYVRGATPALSAALYKPIATNDGDKIVYGEAVHQREFGIEKGIFFSPNGKKVAFYRMDQSMVAHYPLVDYSPHKAVATPFRYPMAGEKSHHVTIGIFDSETDKTTYLKTEGDPELYHTNIAWVPDNRGIVVAHINRSQNELAMCLYDSKLGDKVRTLFVEKEEKYLDPGIAPIFLPNAPEDFLWVSRRDGFYHIYHYDLTGKLFNQLTQGDWEVLSIEGFSPKGEAVIFTATKSSPLENRLYSVDLAGGNVKDLTPEEGRHYVQYNRHTGAFIDVHSAPQVPRIIALRTLSGSVRSKSNTLLEASDPTSGYNMPTIEIGTLATTDGETPLYYRLVKPINFDPTHQYPTIVYVYGGPHAQMITNDWLGGASGWDIYMAQQGYVVFTLDNRGSTNRGKDFEQAIWRQVGTAEMEDQMQGIKFLTSQSWVDSSRIGIYGWSFGGFMTTNLMLSYPEIFKVGVAGGPVMDWSRYEIMYGERYNGSPESNPEGYQRNNLTLRAGDLKGRLLLIHGVQDNVVVWQHAMAFVQAAIKAGTHPDCFYYPTHQHNVIGPDRVHLNTIITRYFEDHL